MTETDRVWLYSLGAKGEWPERVECIHRFTPAPFVVRDWLMCRLSLPAYAITKDERAVQFNDTDVDDLFANYHGRYPSGLSSFIIHFADEEDYVVFALAFGQHFVIADSVSS